METLLIDRFKVSFYVFWLSAIFYFICDVFVLVLVNINHRYVDSLLAMLLVSVVCELSPSIVEQTKVCAVVAREY